MVVEGIFFFHLQKQLMSFGCLELHNELLEGVDLIIVNYQERKCTEAEQPVI
jgi:hypothetical protein